ncbi:hypothetical protein [Paenibacillus sp. FSL K6-2524]|uniref:hypothetical protein n=1 Tax=Paenibacillus sp. FSL K6-2524 TaxID=2954516 RepID=UPI0030F9F252
MKKTEIFNLLAIITNFVPSFDIKDQVRINSWQRVIGEKMTYAEAEKYLYEHFEESRFPPLPFDLLKRIPRKIETVTITDEERDHLGQVYRKQSERNATKRGVARELPKRPESIPGE